MYFSGIADEAGDSIDVQIKAHRELGWDHIELRGVNGKPWTDATDTEFDDVCAKLDAAGMKISCFASGIANWATKITDPLENDLAILERSIPRMKKTGTKYIRTMSWPNDGLPEDEWRASAVERMKKLAQTAESGSVTLVLENCDGWASTSAENYGKFFELVDSPALKAVYDTGNAASHGHPDSWEWYRKARPHIAYVHIKSSTVGTEAQPAVHTWPEEGDSKVLETLADLFKTGYDGGISIEPHLKKVIHAGKEIDDASAAYDSYIEYGKRTVAVVEKARD